MTPVMAWLLAPVLLLQDDPLARGEAWLADVGRAWSAKMPGPRTFGVYLNRKWMGKATFRVVPAVGRSLSVFDCTFDTEMKLGPLKGTQRYRYFLDARMAMVSGEAEVKDHEGEETIRFTVANGTWKRTREKGGCIFEIGGPVPRAATFAPPEGETAVYKLDGSAPVSARRKGTTVEVRDDDGDAFIALLDEAGDPSDIRSTEMPIRIRRIAPEEEGRDLDRAEVVVEPPERTVIEFFQAGMRKSEKALARLIDSEGRALVLGIGSPQSDSETPQQLLKTCFESFKIERAERGTRRWRSDRQGLSLDLPAEWTLTEPEPAADLVVANIEGEGINVKGNVIVEPFEGTAADFSPLLIKAMEAQGWKLVEFNNKPEDPRMTMIMEGKQTIKLYARWIKLDGNVARVTFYSARSDFDHYRTRFSQSADSLQKNEAR